MPDYVYLLESRLSRAQQSALRSIGEAAASLGFTVFLAGGAIRDLTSGASVRDLDVVVKGNALKLKKPLEKAGGVLWGEHEPSRTLHLCFPAGVRVEIATARREVFPKPGKPVYHWDDIYEDLHRRDFTANAMALSLNEHSYGLLMDPLNGVADIEMRQLRLVSNYGFLEDPIRLVRATRLAARMGWDLEERTKTRYQAAKEEGVIDAISAYQKGYELEEIGHEEDGLRTLAALESEGWMRHLFPAWTTAKADTQGLEEMHRLRTQIEMQGVSLGASAISMQLLTAKLPAKDLAALKRMIVRPGFVENWNRLDSIAKEFAKELTAKSAAAPSAAWKLFTSADPEAVLWLGLKTKSAQIQTRYRDFTSVWPEAKQRIPYALMLEMRITPELPGYDDLLQALFLATIDGKLESEEDIRAFLEPYSPPAPPPPVTVRRTRGSRKAEAKGGQTAPEKKEVAEESPGEPAGEKAAKEPRPQSLAKKSAAKAGGKVTVKAETKRQERAAAPAAAPKRKTETRASSGKAAEKKTRAGKHEPSSLKSHPAKAGAQNSKVLASRKSHASHSGQASGAASKGKNRTGASGTGPSGKKSSTGASGVNHAKHSPSRNPSHKAVKKANKTGHAR